MGDIRWMELHSHFINVDDIGDLMCSWNGRLMEFVTSVAFSPVYSCRLEIPSYPHGWIWLHVSLSFF